MRNVTATGFCFTLLSVSACTRDTSIAESHAATTRDPVTAHRVHRLIDFHSPESAKYDAELDAYFVSNMLGFGSVKDGNGYITRVPAGDPSRAAHLVQGGRHGVTLHAPKGMAIHGDTLWVADIDALRAFDRHSGAPLGTIEMAAHGAVLLNDMVIGPDDRLYVTDTGRHLQGRRQDLRDRARARGGDHRCRAAVGTPQRHHLGRAHQALPPRELRSFPQPCLVVRSR
jgi:hypothetical protein